MMMTRHTVEQLWGWTRGGYAGEEMIDAIQTLEGTVEELRGLESVRLYLGEHDHEYPFEDGEMVSGDEEYRD